VAATNFVQGSNVDDGTFNLVLPFTYSLYGIPYTSVNASSNGNLQFQTADTAYSNACLPDTTLGAAIMPHWDDLLLTSGGIYTSVTGTAPNRTFNIEWRGGFFGTTGRVDFEVQLLEGSSAFHVIYGTIDGGGASATVGTQASGTGPFTQFECNTAGTLSVGQKLTFSPALCNTPTRTVTPGGPSNTRTRTATATPAGQCTPTTPGWSAGPALPNPPATLVRAVGVYFPANGKFYTVGGRTSDAAGSDYQRVLEYTPGTPGTWVQKAATLPDNFMNNMACGVLTVSGTPQIYCVGGSFATGTTATARVFSYNPATDTVTTLAAGDNWPGNDAGTILPGGFAVVANKLYIIGGFNINVGMTQQTWQFDATAAVGSKWVQKLDYPQQRGYVPAAAIGNLIYTAGGPLWDGTTLQDTADSYKYDTVANTWTPITNTPRATGETRAVVVGGAVWVLGGGRTTPNPSNLVDVYNVAGNSWSAGPAFTNARRNFPADSDGSTVWLAGGYEPTTAAGDMEIYRSGVPCGTATPTSPPVNTNTATRTNTPVSTVQGATNTPTRTNTPPTGATNTPTTGPTSTVWGC